MKKINLIIFSLLLGLLFSACETDINKVTMSADPSQPTLEDLSISVDFTMANAESAVSFSWSAADFGFAASITYALEASATEAFSEYATLFSTQNLTGTVTVGDLNGILLAWGKEVGQSADLYYRVKASVTTNEYVTSAVKSKSFIPFETLIDYPMIYVPGAYQGWSPGAENGRLYSYGFDSRYQSTIRLKDGDNATVQFKITPAANWDNDWGGSLTQSGDNYSGTMTPKGSNFEVAAGVYELDVDINALTIALKKTDDWGIIGDATPTGWDSDTDMFYNGQRKMWEITLDLNAGTFKFRANDGWDVNYGDSGADGSLDAGGDNIAIAEAGNYTIRFSTEKLTYKVTKN